MTLRLSSIAALFALVAGAAASGDEPLIDLEGWRAPDASPALIWTEVDREADEETAARYSVVGGRFVENDGEVDPVVKVEAWPNGVFDEPRALRDPLLPALADYQHSPRWSDIGETPFPLIATSVLREIASDYEEECERMGGALVPGGCVAPFNLVGGVYER